ncbi:MAG: DUF87 domain-containing protein [Acidimicrobiaceae bacterium]|nr:DUF87 domain-containing protein [Acidimicrobiaceae bacterium]
MSTNQPDQTRDQAPEDLAGSLSDIASEHHRQRLFNEGRMVGDVIELDYSHALVLVHDSAKQRVGGVQQGALIVAARTSDTSRAPTTCLLLRVLKGSPLPNDVQAKQARFDAAQRVADSPDNWDDRKNTDLFTQDMMRYSGVRCRVLGSLEQSQGENPPAWQFHSDVDNFYAGQGMKVYKPTGMALEAILRAASRATSDATSAQIGRVRYATSAPSDSARVVITSEDFLAQRTALFGMTRTGKSNTAKLIAQAVFQLRHSTPSVRVGQLIFDPNGEYANDNPQDAGCLRNLATSESDPRSGVATYGLFPHPYDEYRRITKFNFFGAALPHQHPGTAAAEEALRGLQQGKEILNHHLAGESSGYIRPFVALELKVPPDATDRGGWTRFRRQVLIYQSILASAGFAPPNYPPDTTNLFSEKIRGAMGNDPDLAPHVGRLASSRLDWDSLHKFASSFADWFKSDAFKAFDRDYQSRSESKDGIARSWADQPLLDLLKFYDNTRGRNVASDARIWHNAEQTGDYVQDVVSDLQAGRLVIIDQSIGSPDMNRNAGERIMQALFASQQKAFTEPKTDSETGQLTKPPSVIVYVEEAHTLLPSGNDDLTSPWVRAAKEGAKFNIGLVYSTQEPSSIQSNILKNTENWFIAHLNNTDETRQLAKFNDFEDFADTLISVNEVGYLRMRTRSSRFTLPVQVDKFAVSTTLEGQTDAV